MRSDEGGGEKQCEAVKVDKRCILLTVSSVAVIIGGLIVALVASH